MAFLLSVLVERWEWETGSEIEISDLRMALNGGLHAVVYMARRKWWSNEVKVIDNWNEE